jgi:ligand-binding SRPBCC domain-containing protein
MRNFFTLSAFVSCNVARPAQKNSRFFSKISGLFMLLNFIIVFNAQADYTVPAGTTIDASTLVNMTGVLTIDGRVNLTQNTTLKFTSVIINGPLGNIYWLNNSDLIFPTGTSIIITNPGTSAGMQPTAGNGTGSQRLIIGTITFAVSSDNANNAYFSFEQFNEFGGLPEYQITGDQNECAGTAVALMIQPVRTVSGITHTYQWSITPGAVFSPNSTSSSVNLNNLPAGTYTVQCIASTKSSKSDIFNTTKTLSMTIRPKNTWLGITSNWSDAVNWCPAVPKDIQDVVIPVLGSGFVYPVIQNGKSGVKSITIQPGATLTIDNSGSLQVFGTIINNGIFNAQQGSVEFSGAAIQTISGSMFKNKTIGNLIVSNTAGLEISKVTGDTLNITGNLTFGTETASLKTGDNITLKSTIDGTANIGVVGNQNGISGKFIVERYINTGTNKSLGQHGKAWMLLATPTKGSTIFESWQEKAVSDGKLPMKNNSIGFGTLLTTANNNVPVNGFDYYTGAGSSIKTYVSATNNFDNGPVSTNELIYNEKGYLVMVRGDRSVYTSSANAVPVVLRTKGEIIRGTTNAIPVKANSWESIGNPYASKIYINKIQRSGGVDEFIFVWDPKLGGAYGLGAYQTLYKNGDNYSAIPGGGSYGNGSVSSIESGQAFLVQATKTAGSVFFTEDAKLPLVLNSVQRGGVPSSNISSLRTRIYGLSTGAPVLADGNILLMDDSFSNDIDGRDARKMGNSAENFSIRSGGNMLTVESRQNITGNDTLFFNMSGMIAQNYAMEIAAINMAKPGRQAWLEDKFLQTKTAIDLTANTTIDFTISGQAGANASDRFSIIFRPAFVLPVTFKEVKATVNNTNVLVEWKVESESNLKEYEVEKSLDGNTFSIAATITADKTNAGNYQWLDQNPASGFNYYRIRSVDLDGKTSLTQIVKVKTETSTGTISVYPNPVANGVLNLQLGNQPEGVYNLRLLNPVGQVLLAKKINHAGGNHSEKINWDHSMPKGVYTLEISNTQTGVKIIKVMY